MSKFVARIFKKKKAEARGDTGEASKTSVSDGVGPLEIYNDCEGNASGVDLVFIHGLRGSRLKTWSSGNVFWPRDLLKDDVKNSRVITWGYDASVANVFTYASKESIFGHADTLLSDLARMRRGITRPIVFVCHSLGGLVVKEALIKSAAYNSHRRHPAMGEIYASTVGVIFLGTPHRGSSQETLGEVVANVARLSFRQPNMQLLQTLKPDAGILENQRDQFTTISSTLSIVCIREELPTGVGLIVKEASASYDGFNVLRDSINANHMNMVKFASKGDEGYKRTLGHIDDIRNAQLRVIQQDDEKTESRKNEILEALKFSMMHDREEGIDEAYTQTCSWILDHQSTVNKTSVKPSQFVSWLKNDETFFWISGKAGCGKSTLMKYVYENGKTKEELSLWADKHLILAGYFFFDRGSKEQKSREGMLRSILHQVLNSRHDLIPKVFNQFFGDKLPLPLPQRFISWTNLSGAFISMLDHLRDSKICLFLDGLDEYRMVDRTDQYTEEELDLIYDGANEDEAWGQSTWIKDGHREIMQFLRQLKSYSNVKACISSRELVVFEQGFRNLPRLQVHEHTAKSIAQYCEGRLTEDAPDLIDRSDFVSSITAKSFGVFLWVRLIVDMLIDGYDDGNSKEELLKTLEGLPQRLGGKDGLYMHMMHTIEWKYLPESKRLFQLVMEWDSLVGPLDIVTLFLAEPGHLKAGSEQELWARCDPVLLKSWEELRPRWTDLQRRLKSRCGGLLEGTEKVQFMHQTAKEFMCRNYLSDKIFRNSAGFIGETDLKLAMLSASIRRLKCCREAAFESDSAKLLEDFNDEMLDPYQSLGAPIRGCELLSSALSLCHFFRTSCSQPDHLIGLLDELDNAGDQLARNVRDEFPALFRKSNTATASWIELFFSQKSLQSNSHELKVKTFLELAIGRGIFPYVEAKFRGKGVPRPQLQVLLLRASRQLTLQLLGNSYIIVCSGSSKISEMLFHEGANPNYRDADSNAAMALETRTAWTGLLQEGNGRHNMQEWAAIVKVFLKHGADPTVQWRYDPHDKENREAMEISTPDTIINSLIANKPQYRKELAEIKDLLGKAKANLGLTE